MQMQITLLKQYKQTQPEERVTHASHQLLKFNVREKARTNEHGPSTISRELTRNSCDGVNPINSADVCITKRRIHLCPVSKLHIERILFGIVYPLL